MEFLRPVPVCFPITRRYGESSKSFNYRLNKETGLWESGLFCSNCLDKDPCSCKFPDPSGLHYGIDFGCPNGTPFVAMADGMIIRVEYERSCDIHSSGSRVIQLVSKIGYDSFKIIYKNVGEIIEKPGARTIRAGDRIGYTNYEGDGSPYLHVEMRDLKNQWRDIPIDIGESCDGFRKT